jgi:hypothetical protein
MNFELNIPKWEIDLTAFQKLDLPIQEFVGAAERINAEIARSIGPALSVIAECGAELKRALESHALEMAKFETFERYELVVPEFMRDLHRPLAIDFRNEQPAVMRDEPRPYGGDGEKRRIGF